jgi:DNA replication and repair protein RecF
VVKRLALMEKLKVHANEALQFLTNNQESMVLEYTGVQQTDMAVLKQKLLHDYETSLEKDLNLGYTTVGPHRDDFKIVVNNIDIRHFGSQGQQRTCALALKLAELEVFKDNIGEYPVLLLDDVLSELDESRQKKLLEKVSGIQTILTGTSFNFDLPHTKFVVEQGSITTQNKQKPPM